MSHKVWYDTSLLCPSCSKRISGYNAGFVSTDFLVEMSDVTVTIGQKIDVDKDDFFDAFIPLTDNALNGTAFSALEEWTCPDCTGYYCAVIEFSLDENSTAKYDQYIFVSAKTAVFGMDVLSEVDFVSVYIDEWLGDVPKIGERYDGDDKIVDWIHRHRKK